jgi:hypothetical protein
MSHTFSTRTHNLATCYRWDLTLSFCHCVNYLCHTHILSYVQLSLPHTHPSVVRAVISATHTSFCRTCSYLCHTHILLSYVQLSLPHRHPSAMREVISATHTSFCHCVQLSLPHPHPEIHLLPHPLLSPPSAPHPYPTHIHHLLLNIIISYSPTHLLTQHIFITYAHIPGTCQMGLYAYPFPVHALLFTIPKSICTYTPICPATCQMGLYT